LLTLDYDWVLFNSLGVVVDGLVLVLAAEKLHRPVGGRRERGEPAAFGLEVRLLRANTIRP
jgi:hypothetical protein